MNQQTPEPDPQVVAVAALLVILATVGLLLIVLGALYGWGVPVAVVLLTGITVQALG